MLRFQSDPDIIFTNILDHAFILCLGIVNNQGEYFEEDFPCSFTNYSKDSFINTVKKLIKCNKSNKKWFLNDYNYVLIYDCLNLYCDLTKQLYGKDEPIFEINGYKIYKIDFNNLIDYYFWDTDFLEDVDVYLSQSDEHKKTYGEEAFGVISGMKAHKDELLIKIDEKGEFSPKNPESGIFRKNSKKYPNW